MPPSLSRGADTRASGRVWRASAFRIALSLCLLALASCASGRGGGLGHAPDDGATPPWAIPAEAYGSQRLYRVSYDGPEGEGSFRVTLRLASPLRYQLQAADPVGRALWGVDVTSGQGIWLDHRNKVTCAFRGSFDVPGIPLGPFPLFSLPSLLLGRVPAEPAAGSEPEQTDRPGPGDGKEVELSDDLGRRWIADMEGDGTVEGWTLWEEGKPTVWFQRRDSWAYLSDHARGIQLRWREVLRESLAQEPQALVPPSGYREGSCRDLYEPRPGI